MHSWIMSASESTPGLITITGRHHILTQHASER